MCPKQRILVVENLDGLRKTYITGLKLAGFTVDGAGSLQEALDLIDAKTYLVMVIDLMLRDPKDSSKEGLQVLDRSQELGEGTLSIVLSGQEEPQMAADTIKEHGAFYYVAKSKVLESGMEYLVGLVSKATKSARIKKYGDADNILSVLAGTDGAIVWTDRCLRILRPEGGYAGLKSFFTGFCDPMVPLMPLREVSQPLVVHEERRFASGRFWSKGLGLPVELVACRAEEASELLGEESDSRWDESDLLAEPYESHELAGYAFRLEGVARSEFVEKL